MNDATRMSARRRALRRWESGAGTEGAGAEGAGVAGAGVAGVRADESGAGAWAGAAGAGAWAGAADGAGSRSAGTWVAGDWPVGAGDRPVGAGDWPVGAGDWSVGAGDWSVGAWATGVWPAERPPAGIRSACAAGPAAGSGFGRVALRPGSRPVSRMRCSVPRRQTGARWEGAVRFREEEARGGVDRDGSDRDETDGDDTDGDDTDRRGLSGMRDGGMMSFRQSNTERFVSDVQ